MTILLGLKKEYVEIILAFSFLQPPAAGEEQHEGTGFSGYLKRHKSQAPYPPPPNLA